MRDDPLKNLAIVQAVKDEPRLYERESGIPKKELDRLWDQVGSKVELSGTRGINSVNAYTQLASSIIGDKTIIYFIAQSLTSRSCRP